MKQDKILQDYFNSRKKEVSLPDLEKNIMNRVYFTAKKRQKRSYAWNLCLVSIVSLLLSGGGIYLLKDYITFKGKDLQSLLSATFNNAENYILWVFIAIATLILLFLDYFFRNQRRKTSK